MNPKKQALSGLVRIGGSNLANNITILRILLVPVFIACLLYYSEDRSHLRVIAFVTFMFACVTDAVDGWIARKFTQVSVLGSYIDPIADKLLLISGFLSCSLMTNLSQDMKIPAWVTISVISRDVIILIGSALIFLTTGRLKAEPLFIGKATTVLQMIVLGAALFGVPSGLMQALFIATVLFTALSGILYIRMGERLLQ